MPGLADLLQRDAGNMWLFIPSAMLLGALHGLEPGHSKTMMAAFIVAVRGTVGQAVLLGVSAAISHSLVVWLVALGGLYLGRNFQETDEPYFQLVSALIMMGVALWMFWRLRRAQQPAKAHGHHHGHGHEHGHGDHQHGDHQHGDHSHPQVASMLVGEESDDAHAKQHAKEIETRFAGRDVTTGQIVLFGLTGGLIPCPAAITVLLLCLQLKQIAAGAVLVTGFSVGLAVTMVMAGVIAAVGVRGATKRWPWIEGVLQRAPYFSVGLILIIGSILAVQAYITLRGW